MSTSVIDVSVVIPAHNAERYVCQAIDSAWQQAGVTLEVIVVDNGSTDQTRAVIEQKYHSSVRVVDEPRLGIGFARNAGIQAAAGKHVALLDADDIWMAGKLQRQISELADDSETGLVFCHGYEFHDPGLSPQQCREIACRPDPYAFLIPSGLLATRATFHRVGDFPHMPAGEFVAWYGWAQSLGFRTLVLPDVLVRRRVHAHNTSRGVNAARGYVQAAKWLMDRRRQAL